MAARRGDDEYDDELSQHYPPNYEPEERCEENAGGPSEEDLRELGANNPDLDTIPCPQCGKPVFDDADCCPHCGRSIMRPTSHRLWIVLVAAFFLTGILYKWVFTLIEFLWTLLG